MFRLPLRGEVGRDRDNDTADVLAAKRALARLGYYSAPDYGFDGYSDRPFEDGLRTYQAERGLRQDGWAAPGGETHRNIDLDLSGEKRPFGHDLPRDGRFTGSVGVNADNERPDVQLAQRLLGALGLYRYDRTAEPHGFMDDAIEQAIFHVQRQRGLPETGRFEADDYVMLLPGPTPGQVRRSQGSELLLLDRPDDRSIGRRSLLIPASYAPSDGVDRSDRPNTERPGAETQVAVAPAALAALAQFLLRFGPPTIAGAELARRSLDPTLRPGPPTAPPPPPEQRQLPGSGPGSIGNPVLADPKPEILQPPQGTPAQAPIHDQLPGSVPELQDRIVSIILENRRGNDFTKAQLDEIRDYAKRLAVTLGDVAKDVQHMFGGRDDKGNPIKELFLKNRLTRSRAGGSYGDLTFENRETGRRLHIETVDIDPRTGQMTKRESARDARLRGNTNDGDIIINIPKSVNGRPVDLDPFSGAIKDALREISTRL